MLIFSLVIISYGQTVQAADADFWSMFRHDPSHSGYSTSGGPLSSNVLWNYTTGGAVFSSPAVSNGYVYIGSSDKDVYCLNAQTGAKVWSYTTGSYYIDSSPAVSGGFVYVASTDGNLYCLDALTGAKIWSRAIGDAGYSSPAVSGGFVYIGSTDGNLYCLNASTGIKIWNSTVGSDVFSSPAVVNGYVYVGSSVLTSNPGYFDGQVWCLNAINGALVWNYNISYTIESSGSVVSSPAVSGNYLYVGSDDHNVYCLNAINGALVWNYTTGFWVESSPAVANGYVYVGSYDGKIYCLNALTGAKVWDFTATSTVFSSPAISGSYLYVGSDDGKVWCLNASSGALVWNYTAGGYIFSSPAVSGGNLYIGSDDGKVYAFGAATILQNASLSMQTSVPSVIVDTSFTISGVLTPARSGTVIIWESINGSDFTILNSATLVNGAYSYTFSPSAVGTYQFYASWPGDALYYSAQSTTEIFEVGPVPVMQNATLTISAPSVAVGTAVTISGSLSSVQTGNVTILRSFNNGAFTSIGVAALSNGAWSYQTALNEIGTYQFKAYWPGNASYNAASSDIVTITAIASSGTSTSGVDPLWYVVIAAVVIVAIAAAVYFMRRK